MTHKILNALFTSLLDSKSRFRYVFLLNLLSPVLSFYVRHFPQVFAKFGLVFLKWPYWNLNCDISPQNVLLGSSREKTIMVFTVIYYLILTTKFLNFFMLYLFQLKVPWAEYRSVSLSYSKLIFVIFSYLISLCPGDSQLTDIWENIE